MNNKDICSFILQVILCAIILLLERKNEGLRYEVKRLKDWGFDEERFSLDPPQEDDELEGGK